jgi:hypothetical protein
MKYVCVFCGSSKGNDAAYEQGALALADALVAAGLGLVYGGAQRGLMGVLADRVLAGGGQVVGVMPTRMIDSELQHLGVSELVITRDMHERKAQMALRSDAFVAMPGGFGTLEELTEVVTWAQLGLHDKRCGLLNVAGYFDPFVDFIAHMVRAGFVREAQSDLLRVAADPRELLQQLGLIC